ncbi:MAG: potassium/proton antiporter [Bacteroidales bacterium]
MFAATFTDSVLLVVALILFASVIASKTSFRVGIPTLFFFLIIGILAGHEGIVGIEFDNPRIAQFIGIVALNFILFVGGFNTHYREVRPVIVHSALLSLLGVLFTTTFIGVFVWWFLPSFSLIEGMLLGAIVSSTDAAAVFSVLRSRQLELRGGLRHILEFESGSNDPMAYILTITFLSLLMHPEESLLAKIPMVLLQLVIGLAVALAVGWIGKRVINRVRLESDSLYVVLFIAFIFFAYALADIAYGNGFLAVYVFSLYLGNQKLIHKRATAKFFDGIAWIMQITIFITLGLLVYPSKIVPIVGVGVAIAAFIMFIARPLSVFLCLTPLKVPWNKQLFVSWVGLKGAVPIVFATYPLVAGIDKADTIFNIVFFVSAISVLVQGTTLSPVAKWLKVTQPFKRKRNIFIDLEVTEQEDVKSRFVEVKMPKDSPALGISLVELSLPQRAVISFIIRDGHYITPKGGTCLEKNDKLLVAAEDATSMLNALEKLGVQDQVDWL